MSAPASSRRRYDTPVRAQKVAATRERIVQAGSELVHGFASWDWQELTFRAVAERAGVGERTVYRHFPTERHLHDAVMALADEMPHRAAEWEAIVDRYGLRAPRSLDEFVGQSFVYADLLLGYGRDRVPMPQLVSTIKIRQAGFTDCVDSEADLAAWFDQLRARRLIPPRR